MIIKKKVIPTGTEGNVNPDMLADTYEFPTYLDEAATQELITQLKAYADRELVSSTVTITFVADATSIPNVSGTVVVQVPKGSTLSEVLDTQIPDPDTENTGTVTVDDAVRYVIEPSPDYETAPGQVISWEDRDTMIFNESTTLFVCVQ